MNNRFNYIVVLGSGGTIGADTEEEAQIVAIKREMQWDLVAAIDTPRGRIEGPRLRALIGAAPDPETAPLPLLPSPTRRPAGAQEYIEYKMTLLQRFEAILREAGSHGAA